MNVEIISPADIDLVFSVEETGESFSENAKIKSEYLYQISKIPTLADDSGLCVNSLNGNPGIRSARYGSPDLDDKGRAEYLLKEMDQITEREAWFECCIAYTDATGSNTFSGICPGFITTDYDLEGSKFGYDPVFYSTDLDNRFSQVNVEDKNRVSHRGKALHAFKNYLIKNSN